MGSTYKGITNIGNESLWIMVAPVKMWMQVYAHTHTLIRHTLELCCLILFTCKTVQREIVKFKDHLILQYRQH